MNPEAGLIQGPFRSEVERIARDHPLMPAPEVFRIARGQLPEPPAPPPRPPKPPVETPMELQF